MNTKTKNILKSVVIILILFAFVLALRLPAANINGIPSELKGDYVDSSGLPYFSEMDSYYNLRMTQDYFDHGYYGDALVNNTQIDNHRYSPFGANTTNDLGIAVTTTWLHSLAQFFGDFDIKTVAFWTGSIIASLAVIPAYLLLRRVTNDYGAITASLLIALSPNYFAHTFPGFFDTDMFYFIFPLFMILFFFESIRSDNKTHKILFAILTIITILGFSQAWDGYVFYIAMLGLFVIFYLIINFIMSIRDSTEHMSLSTRIKKFFTRSDILLIIGLVVLLVVIFNIVDSFGIVGIIGNVLSGFALQAKTTLSGFPNVSISIGELQIPNLISGGVTGAFLADSGSAINGIGGITCLFASLIVLYTFVVRLFKLQKTNVKTTSSGKLPKSQRVSPAVKADKSQFSLNLNQIENFGAKSEHHQSKKDTILYLSLFIVWTISAALAVTQGARFITLLILPFGILTGIFVGYAADYIKYKRISDKKLIALIVIFALIGSYPILNQINWTLGIAVFGIILIIVAVLYQLKKPLVYNDIPYTKYLAIFCIFLAIVSPTICFAQYTADHIGPGTSDYMWNSMEWINETQPKDTVIASWWDFGYLFEIAADRQTVFDGGMQGMEGRAYWLGHAMTTKNLELSAGIFRMLGTSGYDPIYYKLCPYTNSSNGTTAKILDDILPQAKSDAQSTLTNKYKIPSSVAADVVQLTHPDNPRPVIFVASSDMLQKASWWTYFGNWKFDGEDTDPYQYYVSTNQTQLNASGQSGEILLLQDYGVNFTVNITRGANNNTNAQVVSKFANNGSTTIVNGSEYNPLKAGHILVIEDGYLIKNESIKGVSDGNFTLYVMGYNGTYNAILMSNELVDSMFTQLYLLGGVGQDVFTQVHMDTGVSLWKVNFENTAAGGNPSSSTAEVSNSSNNNTTSTS